jgi:hypothetical protein
MTDKTVSVPQLLSWISVDQRLPKKGTNVLAFCPNYSGNREDCIVRTWMESDLKFAVQADCGEKTGLVTHWMRVPKPPSKQSNCVEIAMFAFRCGTCSEDFHIDFTPSFCPKCGVGFLTERAFGEKQ